MNTNRLDTKQIKISSNNNNNINQIKKKRQREDIEDSAILIGAVTSK
jgi:hypothetical protein